MITPEVRAQAAALAVFVAENGADAMIGFDGASEAAINLYWSAWGRVCTMLRVPVADALDPKYDLAARDLILGGWEPEVVS